MNDSIRSNAQCDALIAKKNLLTHPFYQAWSNGTLPVEALKTYAREYGAFIAGVGLGWERAGWSDIAAIEDGHARVWERTFAASLGTSVGEPQIPEVAALIEAEGELFAEKASAMGALYAFEAQQPFTAQSKLKGLKEHYPQLPEACGVYFEMHENDFDEPSMLAEGMAQLSDAEQALAVAACERMSCALWDALSGIHARYGGESACAMG